MLTFQVACVLGLCVPLASRGDDGEFADRPEGGPKWTFGPAPDQQALRRVIEAGRPVIRFDSAAGRGYACAPWPVGIEGFELTCEVALERGGYESWRYPGVYVAVASAPPDQMGEDDIALLMAVHKEGLAASVRRGETFGPNRERIHATAGPYSRFMDRELAPRFALNQGGAGGHFYSILWPNPNLAGTRLRLRIERTAESEVRFAAYHADFEKGAEPWWQAKWTLPAGPAKKPLGCVVVQTVLNPAEYAKTADELKPVARNYPAGRIQKLEGRLLSGPPHPTLTGFYGKSALAGGSHIDLRGDGLENGATVWIADKPATAVAATSPQELRCTLPDLSAGQRYPVRVVNPSGLSGELPGGLFYGRLIERIEPREALPRGGDVVTVVGGGFDKDTAFDFGGSRAEVVKVLDSTRVQVRVPPGRTGPVRVEARSGDQPFAGEPLFGYADHPYLLFRASDLADLRQKFREPMFAAYRTLILSNADGVPPGGAETEKSGKAGIADLLWGYLLSGEPKYRDRLLEAVNEESRSIQHGEFRMMAGADMALAYDALFAELTPQQKLRLQDYLDRVVRVYVDRVRGNDWWYVDNPSNTIPVGACGGGLAGLALMHGAPEARAAVDYAAGAIQKKFRGMSPDGGYVEGTLYWNFALGNYLRFAHALRNATGDDRGLLDAPELRKNYRFVETQLGGDGRFFTFNDTQPWLTGGAVCADLGSRFDQPLLLWLADHMHAQFARGLGVAHENTRGDCVPYAFLWRSRQPAPAEFPGVPVVSRLETMQWGVLRSQGSFQPGLVVGVKGQGGFLTHHAQPDAGSFVLQARGEALLIDPGYYQPAPAAHTLPLIDGKGPEVVRDQGAPVPIRDAFQNGPWRAMTVDATAAYQKTAAAQRVCRHFVMHSDRAVVVLDDIVHAAGTPGQVTSLIQAGFPVAVEADGPSAVVTGKKARLWLRPFAPGVRLSAEGPRDFGRSWVFKKLAEAGEVEWHTLKADYRAATDSPLVTVLVPLAAGEAAPQATVERGKDDVTVRMPGMEPVRFENGAGGWTLKSPAFGVR